MFPIRIRGALSLTLVIREFIFRRDGETHGMINFPLESTEISQVILLPEATYLSLFSSITALAAS
jgi:hypothetical protein